MPAFIEVQYFNSYLLKKLVGKDTGGGYIDSAGTVEGTINANNTAFIGLYPGVGFPGLTINSELNWFVEEGRIRGGFNNVSTDNGVRAYLTEEEPIQQRRSNALIYSGVYNSRTGINNTNVFSTGEAITRALDPINGSIQRTLSEDTNLIVFQENKINRALIDKDTIYTTESGTQTQAGATVIGQFVPYKGEYGISRNPESLAVYSYRKYFTDKDRNAVMRLSNDGLTEISAYGMQDFFRDEFAEIVDEFKPVISTAKLSKKTTGYNNYIECNLDPNQPPLVIGSTVSYNLEGSNNWYSLPTGFVTDIVPLGSRGRVKIYYSSIIPVINTSLGVVNLRIQTITKSRLLGAWDAYSKNYVLSIQDNDTNTSKQPDSYYTLCFDEKINGWVSFYSFKPTIMKSMKNVFYSIQDSSLYQHFSENVQRSNFYGTRTPSNVTFVFNANPSAVKVFKTVSYEGSNGWKVDAFVSDIQQPISRDGNWVNAQDTTKKVYSYLEGSYIDPNSGQRLYAGFNRKENLYVANLVNDSQPMNGEILFGGSISGIKGYIATVTMSTDNTTQVGGPKELFATSTEVVQSNGF